MGRNRSFVVVFGHPGDAYQTFSYVHVFFLFSCILDGLYDTRNRLYIYLILQIRNFSSDFSLSTPGEEGLKRSTEIGRCLWLIHAIECT